MKEFITVAVLNKYITRLFDEDPFLQNLWLKGEISGARLYQQSGHLYFTLKDEDAAVSCVMFKSRAHSLKFKPENGMEVLARGNVSLFSKQGKYQFYVEEMQPFGLGSLFQYLEKLKARLAQEGYFAAEHKQAIPPIARRVGVVTSRDGAALRDILRVLYQRFPGVEVILAHSSVQGVDAPRELALALQSLNEYGNVEVIIIGRGGGSLEDLMAFNSEEVVKAIFDSHIPVISAVGHEVDFSLADLVADLRAATPTQAAQYAVPDFSLLGRELKNLSRRLIRFSTRALSSREEALDRLMMRPIWREPHNNLLQRQEEKLQEKQKSLSRAIQACLRDNDHRLGIAMASLDNLSPLKIMARGYAILNQEGRIVTDVENTEIGQNIQAYLANGNLLLEIKDKEKVDRWRV